MIRVLRCIDASIALKGECIVAARNGTVGDASVKSRGSEGVNP